MREKHILEIDICEEVGIHQQHGVACQIINESQRAYCSKPARFFHTAHLHPRHRLGKMLFDFLGKIVHRDVDISYAIMR